MLLIIARLIAQYKHSVESLAALEIFFLQKYSATRRTPYLVEISLVSSLIWCKNRSAYSRPSARCGSCFATFYAFAVLEGTLSSIATRKHRLINNNLIFILHNIHVNMIKCALLESKLSTLISYPK